MFSLKKNKITYFHYLINDLMLSIKAIKGFSKDLKDLTLKKKNLKILNKEK